MSGERLFVDTFYIQALYNSRDPDHELALRFEDRFEAASQVWMTDAILIEVGNAFAKVNRRFAGQFVTRSLQTPRVHVVAVSRELLRRATELYSARPDKDWGLTDCISFLVMRD